MKPNFLQVGDIVEIIAPASKFDPLVLTKIEGFLRSWGLKARFANDLLGEDLLFANSDEKRLAGLTAALNNHDSKAIWAIRGGYGCARLIPTLAELPKPIHTKWLMGFSDITALHIFVNQQWQWPSLHCASANQIANHLITDESIKATKEFILGHAQPFNIELEAMNEAARTAGEIQTNVIGGNLSVVVTSLGTAWQIDTSGKLLIIEDVNEEPYRIDRMLNHLYQAGALAEIKGLLIGEFTQPENKRSDSEMHSVLQAWIDRLGFPALKIKVGHAKDNLPLAFGVKATLKLGHKPSLSFE